MRGLWDLPERADWFGGGFDDPGIHSICLDPRDRPLAIAISCGAASGAARTAARPGTSAFKGLWAVYVPPEKREEPAYQARTASCNVLSRRQFVSGCSTITASSRTEDAPGLAQVEPVPVSDFGFAVAVHPADPENGLVRAGAGRRAAPCPWRRAGWLKTEASRATFVEQRSGLPQANAFDLIYRHGLDVSADAFHAGSGIDPAPVDRRGRRCDAGRGARPPAAGLLRAVFARAGTLSTGAKSDQAPLDLDPVRARRSGSRS